MLSVSSLIRVTRHIVYKLRVSYVVNENKRRNNSSN